MTQLCVFFIRLVPCQKRNRNFATTIIPCVAETTIIVLRYHSKTFELPGVTLTFHLVQKIGPVTGVQCMMMTSRIWIFTCLTGLVLSSPSVQSQSKSTKQQLVGTESVGDLVQSEQSSATASSGTGAN